MFRQKEIMIAVLFHAGAAIAQQTVDNEQVLKTELKRTQKRIENLEMNQENREKQACSDSIQTSGKLAEKKQAFALNTPSMLPTDAANYKKSSPRFDILIQSRFDYFSDSRLNSTFFLRKAELGVKGHIADKVDFSLELDPVNSRDVFRRTYIRLSHVSWLHIKIGLEKAPIGLEELSSTAGIPFVDRSEVSDLFSAAEEMGVHLESHRQNWLFQFSLTNGGRRLLRDNNEHKDITARIVWAPVFWFSLGGATMQGRIDSLEYDRIRYNGELKLGDNFSGCQGEFYRAKDRDNWSSAFYISAFRAYPVQSRILTDIQPVVRYEYIDRGGAAEFRKTRLLTFGASFLLDKNRSKFQINYLNDLVSTTSRDELRCQYQIEF